MIGITQPTTFTLQYAKFQRNYLWDVLLPDIGVDLGGLVGFAMGQLVQSVSFGDYSIVDGPKMRFGPYEAHFAGLFTVPDIRMTFLKTFPDAVSSYFNAWKNLIIDANGIYSTKSNYQRTIYVRFVDMTGISMGQYKLIGCFPTIFPNYNLSYDDNKVTKVEVKFTVDAIEYSAFTS